MPIVYLGARFSLVLHNMSLPSVPVYTHYSIKKIVMKIKFNWGTGLFLFYVVFVGSLVFQLFKSFQYDNSLVVDDYYAKDLAYQEQYDKVANSMSLSAPVKIKYIATENKLLVTFPKDVSELEKNGAILFYRANDKSQDRALGIQNEKSQTLEIPVEDLTAGEWKVSIDWTANKTSYYNEEVIQIIQP